MSDPAVNKEIKFIENKDPAVQGWYIVYLDYDGTSYDQLGPYETEEDARKLDKLATETYLGMKAKGLL